MLTYSRSSLIASHLTSLYTLIVPSHTTNRHKENKLGLKTFLAARVRLSLPEGFKQYLTFMMCPLQLTIGSVALEGVLGLDLQLKAW